MREKQNLQAQSPGKWDERQIETAIATARYHAGRFARQRRLSRADREDLTQDTLLAILEASSRFDPERGSWSTFVAVLARRVVIDRARLPAPPECVPLEGKPAADILSYLVVPQADLDIALLFGGIDAALPPAPRHLLQRIALHLDVMSARDAGEASPATFYRELRELRCWLRALGLRPATAASARGATLIPSEP